jgi:hypothetical protein
MIAGCAFLLILIAGCSPPEQTATESPTGPSQAAFEPEYVGGYPTAETAERMFEEYDYQAALHFYIWGYAYLNGYGFDRGMAALGGDERSVYIWDKRVQGQHAVMTANGEVIYNCTRVMDVSKEPVVIEIPPRSRGHFFDIGERAYEDTGDLGPDQGKGGKYLAMSADYDGEIPEGYFPFRVEYSNLVMAIIRTFPGSEGSVEAAAEHGKKIKWYPLSEAGNPPPANFVLVGDRPFSQEWPRDERAFEWLAEAFNLESNIPDAALPHLGNMRRLGYEKGKPFNPDARAKAILKRAATSGEAIALSMSLQNRLYKTMPMYDDRQFKSVFYNRSPKFMQKNYEEVEERVHGWHQLCGNFANYIPPKPGVGQFSTSVYHDKDGNNLIGSHTYKLHVPADVPVKQFWQLPVYEVSTRALMFTDQKKSVLSSTEDLKKNADGSVDLYFGPELPEGVSEKNWVKTKPNEGWFSLPRLYAPLEPIIKKEWRWNDIELIEKGEVTSEPGAKFVGGYPTKETAAAAFDEYDYTAAVQFYVWGYAHLNSMGMEKGCAAMGGDERSFYHWDKRIQSKDILMTANTGVIYNWSRYIDLSKGPVVFEVPPRVRGHFYDMGMRAYVDIGDIGPDKGKGGKYLVVSADYDGEIPEGFFEVRSKYSDRITLGFRSFPTAEGSDEAAVELGKTAKWYYLSEGANPHANSHILIGDRPFSQEWPRDEEAFAWYSEIFNMDRVPASGLGHLGNMRRLGIQRGKPFAPDARAQAILKRAARTGKAMVLSMAFRNRQDKAIYDNRQYEPIFLNSSPTFFHEDYEEVEVRAGGWHQLVGNFAQNIPTKPGTGGFYSVAYRDKDGESLIGSNTYRLRVPAKVPVKQFWQIPIYEVTTRSLIDTDQKKSTLSGTDDLRKNDDGSVDLYFGPEAPEGYEQNWIKTKPGEGWFTLPRLYAPLEPILDKTWRWNDIERIR